MNGVYGDTLLKIENVSLELGEKENRKLILKNVNAEIKDIAGHGQVVAVLGPSGIGKTQLFKILSGLQKEPYSGQVLITGKGLQVKYGMVGVVTQKYLVFDHYTVLKNLTTASMQTGLSYEEAKKRSLAMLDRFGLRDKASSYPGQLSGGQCQRVSIAQQLLCSEHFLLMDEPFTGLDPVQKDNVCKLITEVADSNELNTIIITTHDVSAALAVADHLWVIGRDLGADGKVIPGARIQFEYDLISMDLAWHKDIQLSPLFTDFVRDIKEKFRTL